MKRAIISDVHSNLEGLEAVLADIEGQGIKEIYCLGDIIGYGPNPCECIDRIMAIHAGDRATSRLLLKAATIIREIANHAQKLERKGV